MNLEAELQDCSDRLEYITHLDNHEKSTQSQCLLDLLNKYLDILEEYIKELE